MLCKSRQKKPCSLYDFNKDSFILHRGVKDVRNREIRKKKKKKVRNVIYHMIKKTEG